MLHSLVSILIALQGAQPQSEAELSASLTKLQTFVDDQSSVEHAVETAKRCKEMWDTGNYWKALMEADKTYGLSGGREWKALVHDCTVYTSGKTNGEIEATFRAIPTQPK